MREPLFTASGSDVFVSYALNPFGGFKPEYFGSVFHISFGGTSGLNSVLKCSTQSTLRCLDRVTCLFVCTLWICRMRMSKL